MAPNTPTDCAIIVGPYATFDVTDQSNHSKFSSIAHQDFPILAEAENDVSTPFSLDIIHLQSNSEDKIYTSEFFYLQCLAN